MLRVAEWLLPRDHPPILFADLLLGAYHESVALRHSHAPLRGLYWVGAPLRIAKATDDEDLQAVVCVER